MDLSKIRHDYHLSELNEDSFSENPMTDFENWLDEAIHSSNPEPTAMTLITASKEGKPSGRIVLLKEIRDNGLVFYTNYMSYKGLQIAENHSVALVFFWPVIERQVRMEGIIEKLNEKDSDNYFHTRPYDNKMNAWVSNQSTVIENRAVLEKKRIELSMVYKDEKISRPPFWGGYIIFPDRIEFWQGRPNRLNDRILFVKEKNQIWKKSRLSP